jgi:hypothetical protein
MTTMYCMWGESTTKRLAPGPRGLGKNPKMSKMDAHRVYAQVGKAAKSRR